MKANLEGKDFAVRRKPIGSDFLIEYDVLDNDEELGIEVSKEGSHMACGSKGHARPKSSYD